MFWNKKVNNKNLISEDNTLEFWWKSWETIDYIIKEEDIVDSPKEEKKWVFSGMFWKKKDKKSSDINIEEPFKIWWKSWEDIEGIGSEISELEDKRTSDTVEDIEDIIDEKDIVDSPKEEKKWVFSDMFWKKKDKKISNEDENKKTSNIFDDFDIDDELWKEVKNIQDKKDKDWYYYLNVIGNIIKYINLLFIILISLLYTYIYIQNIDTTTNNFKESQILDPICWVILGSKITHDNLCSSISYIKKQTDDKLKEEKKRLFIKEINMLPDFYKKDNFLNSKKTIFLLEKWANRLRPLDIISEFDDLKNKYEPLLKSRISCNNISISSDNILTASCFAYSSWWEWWWIVWFKWDPENIDYQKSNSNDFVKWTSISIASSFINFLDRQDWKLYLLDKQRLFTIENYVNSDSIYTKRTPFIIKMKYSPKG